MVDINTSSSALQAQLQASQQSSRVGTRASLSDNSSARASSPQDVVARRVEARQDTPATDRRAPVRQSSSANNLSSSAEIEDAGRRAQQFASREAPSGRFSNAPENQRPQPLGQIVNILV